MTGFSIPSPVSGFFAEFKLYILAAVGVAFIGLFAHDCRISYLREQHLTALTAGHDALGKAGIKADLHSIDLGIALLASERNTARTERDQARGLVDIQTKSIERLHEETAEAQQEAAANRKLAEQAAQQRDFWVKQARAASTRTERLSDEQEVKECEAVLDSLYSSGF